MRPPYVRLAILATIVFCVSPAVSMAATPVAFVHGFTGSANTWRDAAIRLQARLAIQPSYPGLTWRDVYEKQATQLQSQLSSLPGTTVAVGHSNGGVISREWSRLRPLGGIVTMSTPHRGVPLSYHINDWLGLNFLVVDLIGSITASFGLVYDEWWWMLGAIDHILAWAMGIGQDSVLLLAGATGYQAGLPVMQQMVPGSTYLTGLNSTANVNRESSQVPARVGIVNIAKDFYVGGVYRAVAPDAAGLMNTVMYAGAAALDAYAIQLVSTGNPANIHRAQTMWSLASWLWSHEEWWCRTISDPSPFAYTTAGQCWENDTIVPVWAQVFPGATYLKRTNTGIHTQLTAQSDDLLYDVLTTYMKIPPAGSAPPPPPPSTSASGSNKMTAGQRLLVNERLLSADGRFRFTYQGDGNLVLRREDGTPTWSSKTAGTSIGRVTMQSDGNAVLYTGSGTAAWNSRTNGNPGAYVQALNDGNVVVYSSSKAKLWQTGTASGSTGGSTTSSGTSSVLASGATLMPGQAVVSADGRFRLTYQSDGNLVLYRTGVAPLWATGTSGAGKLKMQTDGNLVIYGSSGSAIWASGTNGYSGAYLRVQSDGNVVIYSSKNTPLWATGTAGS